MPMSCILVVEDDEDTRRLMEAVLSANGYAVILAEDGEDALAKLSSRHVDLMILDLMMPRMDGFELALSIRKVGNSLPILMVTAREAPADKRRGFLAGTDDYMVKPVDEEEMILRIKALLRRARIADERRLLVGKTELDCETLTVSREGQSRELPNKEFLLLFKLLSYPNKIFTRRTLMDELWDTNSGSDPRTVDVHVNRLRERFRDNGDFAIVTVRGLGYKAVLPS